MASLLHTIKGHVVSEVHQFADSVQIVCDSGAELSIFNKCKWEGGSSGDIVGLKVTNVVSDSATIKFFFGESISVETNTTPDEVETLVLSMPGGPLVVVN